MWNFYYSIRVYKNVRENYTNTYTHYCFFLEINKWFLSLAYFTYNGGEQNIWLNDRYYK